MLIKHFSYFRFITSGTLFLLTGIIGIILLADIAYIDASSIYEVFASKDIRFAFILSISTSITATFLSIIVAVPSAYSLSRFSFKGAFLLDILIDLLIVLPVLVIGVSLLVTFRMGAELVESNNYFISLIGGFVSFCGEIFIYKKSGIVLAQFFCAVSFAVRTIKASFDEIDPRTEQVALTLGCSMAGAFWRVALPLAKHGIVAGAVLSWARAFGIFGAIAIVAGAVRQKTEVLPTSIYLEISIGRLEVALAISLVMVFIAFIILFLMRVFLRSNIFGGRS